MDPVSRAVDVLSSARRLVVLTGAGASTESGVPDFRSSGGVWERFDPGEFEYARFLRDPAGLWALRAKLIEALDLRSIRPNPAHEAISAASASMRFVGHVTQNIDGLFLEAGHVREKLREVHGSMRTARCIRCARSSPIEDAEAQLARGVMPPACLECGSALKPGTILFGEALPEDALDEALVWMRHADAVLIVGSSLEVHPVAALPNVALEMGAAIVIVNTSPTSYDADAHAVVREKAGRAVPEILARAGFTAPPA